MKPRIHIIGGPGSGKSYIATKLAQRFNVPVYDLDDLFWDRTALNYGIRADSTERDRRFATIVSQDGWIVEGVYYQWLAPSFDAANIILALTPSVWVRHGRVIKRFILRRLGRIPSKRESLADLLRLLCWSHAYDANNLVRACVFITERGRKLTNCKTFDDAIAATKSLTSD